LLRWRGRLGAGFRFLAVVLILFVAGVALFVRPRDGFVLFLFPAGFLFCDPPESLALCAAMR
jgi:hypothetical protein